MASITFSPAQLSGSAMVPPAKSEAHRALLLAALGSGECRLNGFPPPLCDDNHAMINGITALGAAVRHEGSTLIVTPAPAPRKDAPMVDCHVHACAAALRMLIPAFLVRGQAVRFLMEPALFRRPLDAFEPLVEKLGASMVRTPAQDGGLATVEITGFMPAGQYAIDGSRSSQFASGMLIALAHATDENGLPAPSELTITGPIVSRPYLDMTLKLMQHFRAPYTEASEGLFQLSPVCEPSPAEASVTSDWSQAAVLLCINAMGGNITVEGLSRDENCLQGDSRIVDELARMGASPLKAVEIDCTDIPDIAPILALTCTQAQGMSTLRGVSRLRIKESDRLKATQELLSQLGATTEVSADSDTLRVWGPVKLQGGFEAEARSDHRLVMFLAAAALISDAPITVHGVECLNKSWPGFLATYRALGGKAE
ncbi:MAG: hypothetical protein IKJ26_10270 [Clostridia bacterium]|nr:hypothetical protein [Clostridia bacterium]